MPEQDLTVVLRTIKTLNKKICCLEKRVTILEQGLLERSIIVNNPFFAHDRLLNSNSTNTDITPEVLQIQPPNYDNYDNDLNDYEEDKGPGLINMLIDWFKKKFKK